MVVNTVCTLIGQLQLVSKIYRPQLTQSFSQPKYINWSTTASVRLSMKNVHDEFILNKDLYVFLLTDLKSFIPQDY